MGKSFIRRLGKTSIITANILVGIIFLTGVYSGVFNPEKFWFLSILVMGLPILIFVLVLFFLFWLFVRPAWCVLSVIFISIGWNTTKQIIPPRFFSGYTMQKSPGDLRIMSWNVEQFNILNYKKDPGGMRRMVDLINEYDPDIACFQEAVLGYKPESVNQYSDLIKALKFRDNFYAYRTHYGPNHYYGLMILSKFPIINKQYVRKGRPDFNSDFQYTDLLIGGDTVRVYNIHLQSFQFSNTDRYFLDNNPVGSDITPRYRRVITQIKKSSVKKIVQSDFIRKSMDSTTHSIIVCGDFNDVPGSYAYRTIGKGMKNAFVDKGTGLSRTFIHISPTLRIDNIFVAPEFEVTQFKRIKKELSDHYPIITDVRIN